MEVVQLYVYFIKKNTMREELEKILLENKNSLTSEIIKMALDTSNPEKFIKDLSKDKCHSGVIPKLIDLKYTHFLFDTYYDEIEGIRKDISFAGMGEDMYPNTDIKNDFVWFAIDYITDWLTDDLIHLSKKDSRF